MRERDGRRLVSRVHARATLRQRIMRVLLAVHRYGRARARTPAERAWAARLLDHLQQALDERTPTGGGP